MKKINYLGYATAIVAALAVAAAAMLAFVIDADRVRRELVDVVKARKQRTLRIDGGVSLSFLPALGVRLERATLSEHASDLPFASVESAHVSVRLLPLLSGRVVIDAIEVTGAQATVVRRRDGSTNIDDLLAPETGGEPAFDVRRVSLGRCVLTLRDERSGRALTLSRFDATVGPLSNAAAGKLAANGTLAAAQPRTAAAFGFSGDYAYDLARKHYALTNGAATLNGELFGVPRLDARVSVARADAAGGAVDIDGSTLTLRGGPDEARLDLHADVPRIAFAGDSLQAAVVDVRAAMSSMQRTVAATARLSGLRGERARLRADNLALQVDARLGDTVLKGNIASALTTDAAAAVVELPDYRGSMRIEHPRLVHKSITLPFAGRLRADWAHASLQAEAAARLDDSDIRGRLAMARLAPPSFGFEVTVDRLDAARYLSVPTGAARAAPGFPLDLSALKDLDAQGTLRIGLLRWFDTTARDVVVQIK